LRRLFASRSKLFPPKNLPQSLLTASSKINHVPPLSLITELNGNAAEKQQLEVNIFPNRWLMAIVHTKPLKPEIHITQLRDGYTRQWIAHRLDYMYLRFGYLCVTDFPRNRLMPTLIQSRLFQAPTV